MFCKKVIDWDNPKESATCQSARRINDNTPRDSTSPLPFIRCNTFPSLFGSLILTRTFMSHAHRRQPEQRVDEWDKTYLYSNISILPWAYYDDTFMGGVCLTADMMSQSRREELYAMRLALVSLMILCGRDGKLIWIYPVCLSGSVDREGSFIPYLCSKSWLWYVSLACC